MSALNEYDTFSAGVEIGGLRSKKDIMLLICYMLKTVDRPLSKAKINDIIQNKGIANYFDVVQSISELVSNGNLISEYDDESEEILTISEKGKAATKELEDTLPRTVREKVVGAVVEAMTRERRERENHVVTEKISGGYNVTFSLSDKDDVLMKLTVFAVDSEQVETIKRGFTDDPVRLYSGIIAALSTPASTTNDNDIQ